MIERPQIPDAFKTTLNGAYIDNGLATSGSGLYSSIPLLATWHTLMVKIQICQRAGHGNDIPVLLVCVGMSDSIEMQEYEEGKSKKVEVKRSENKYGRRME